MQPGASTTATRTRPPASRRQRRLLVVAVAAVVILSVAAVAIVLLQRQMLEIEATDLVVTSDAPQVGMTQLHVSLVLRNVGSARVHLQWVTLFANDPRNGTLFDTFTHDDIQLEPGGTRTFSDVTNITGYWSGVAFTIKVFPFSSPGWDSPIVPDQPVTWTA